MIQQRPNTNTITITTLAFMSLEKKLGLSAVSA